MSDIHPNIDPSEMPDSVPTGSTSSAWRIADGSFVRGREGNTEKKNAILGRLTRVGIHEGTIDDGSPYAKLECDLETRDGVVSVGATLKAPTSGKPSWTACINLAQILAEIKPGEWLQLEARAGSKPNKFGRLTTYVNGFRVNPVTKAPTPMRFERTSAPSEADLRAVLDRLLDQIRKHPAFAPRPARPGSDEEWEQNNPYNKPIYDFAAKIVEKGWPSLDAAEPGYLKIACATGKAEYSALSEVPDAVWEELVKAADKVSKLPAALVPYAKAPEEEYDPFAVA